MKKIKIVSSMLLLGALLLSVPAVHAQQGSMMGDGDPSTVLEDKASSQSESIEAIIQEIMAKQQVLVLQDLKLDRINDSSWERLGDAVMEQQHPGTAHELMDSMMGGEGSDSLTQMHINMGKAYLGFGDYAGFGMMGINRGNMMGYDRDYLQGQYHILGTITLLSLILFFSAGTYYFITQSRKNNK